MQLDKKALNLEMLKIAGFTCTEGIWTYPDGVDVDNGVPFFPEDETACFKWLVPLVYEREGIEIIFGDGYCALEMGYGEPSILEDAETPALAFCLAMRELK